MVCSHADTYSAWAGVSPFGSLDSPGVGDGERSQCITHRMCMCLGEGEPGREEARSPGMSRGWVRQAHAHTMWEYLSCLP